MKIKYKKHSLLLVALLGLSGLSSNAFASTTVTGNFIDDIQGLNYTCSSKSTGTTNENGEYTCLVGDDVSFFLGDVALGTLSAQSTMLTPYSLFPTDMDASISLARLLQSVDNDGSDTNSKISIDTNLVSLLPKKTDFASPTFERDIQKALSITLVDASTAEQNLNYSIISAGGDIPIGGHLPVANAGTKQNTKASSTVTLDGSASSDVNSDTLTYSWSIEEKPTGSTASLSDASLVNPSFTADIVGDYVFQLTVNDGTLQSVADSVVVTAAGQSITNNGIGKNNAGLANGAENSGNTAVPVPEPTLTPNTGTLDTSFGGSGFVTHNSAAGGNSTDRGYSVALDGSGNIYVTGRSSNINGDSDMAIWKYKSDGTLDTSFGGDGIVTYGNSAMEYSSDVGNSIVLDVSGNIYVAGYSTSVDGYLDMAIWKYKVDGTLDLSFGGSGIVTHNNAAGGNGVDVAKSIALDISGNIYVTGQSGTVNYSSDMAIWKYKSDGTLDTSFNGTGVVTHNSAAGGNSGDLGNAIVLDISGDIYVTGESRSVSNYDMTIWKYKSDGTLDTSFNGDGIVTHNSAAGGDSSDEGLSIVLDSIGNIYVVGESRSVKSVYDAIIWKYKSDGSLDTSFDADGIVVNSNAAGADRWDVGRAIVLDNSGNIYLAGYSRSLDYSDDMVVWKHKRDGTLDTSFGTDGIVTHNSAAGGNHYDEAHAVALDSSGNLYVAGESYSLDNASDMTIWKYK